MARGGAAVAALGGETVCREMNYCNFFSRGVWALRGVAPPF